MTITIDPTMLCPAWQSVAAAVSTEKDDHAHYRTIHIEEHHDGVHLVASDGALLLTAWVPETPAGLYEPDPSADDVLDSYTVMDTGNRALSLINYVAKTIANGDDIDPDDHRITIEPRTTPGGFPGMGARTVEISTSTETVTLDVWDGAPPQWRQLLDLTGRIATAETALTPAALTKLVKAAKPHELSKISATFAGVNKPIRVEIVNSEPYISGVLMPARIQTATEHEAA